MSGHAVPSEDDQIATKNNLPGMPDGKSTAAPPQVIKDGDLELADIHNTEAKLPLHEDVMQLARLGEIGPVQKLFQEGKIRGDFHDEEGITPLHVR